MAVTLLAYLQWTNAEAKKRELTFMKLTFLDFGTQSVVEQTSEYLPDMQYVFGDVFLINVDVL